MNERNAWPVNERNTWPVNELNAWPVNERNIWPVNELNAWPASQTRRLTVYLIHDLNRDLFMAIITINIPWHTLYYILVLYTHLIGPTHKAAGGSFPRGVNETPGL